MEIKTIEEIIEGSGNDLHWNIAEILKTHGWAVEISPYYTDNITNLAREIDIIATKRFFNDIRKTEENSFVIKMFIECKYVLKEAVLGTEKKNIEKANSFIKESADFLNRGIYGEENRCHYLEQEDVVKAGTIDKSESNNKDYFYKGINGCLNSLLYDKHYCCGGEYFRTIRMPVIIVNEFSKIYKRIFNDGNNKYSSITDNFQMEINYSFLDNLQKPQQKYFLIDVVAKDSLGDFLNKLEEKDVSLFKEQFVGFIKPQQASR